METIPTPPGALLKPLSQLIEPVLVFPEQFGDDWTPESVQRLADATDQGERDVAPIEERLNTLNDAMAEGWTPTRVIENELDHLGNVLSPYHLSRYLTEARVTLQDAEADLVSWQRMTPVQRDQRCTEREREQAALAARREAEAQLRQRHTAFYATMKRANVSPPRRLDNEIANWSLA